MKYILFCLLIWIVYESGYQYAHYVVARECRLLGKFYVGDTVYECTAIVDKSEKSVEKSQENN